MLHVNRRLPAAFSWHQTNASNMDGVANVLVVERIIHFFAKIAFATCIQTPNLLLFWMHIGPLIVSQKECQT